MNVKLLFKEKEQTINALLADGNWKHTDQYKVEPEDSNDLGCAHIYRLSMEITADEEVALVYLFQRLYMDDTASKKDAAPLSANDLLSWLLNSGYISWERSVLESGPGSSIGVRLNPQIGWNKLQEGIRELLEKQGHVYKNSQEIAPAMLFGDQNVKAVTAFKDYEKDGVFFDYLYFIETDKAWMYFTWGDVL